MNTFLSTAAGSTTTPASSAPPSTGVEALERVAASLYPQPAPRPVDQPPNAAVAAVRAADPAREIYKDEVQLGGAVRDLALATNHRGTAESLARQQVSLASVFTDIGAGRDDVARFAGLASGMATTPPTPEQKLAWERAAVKDLRAEYGTNFDSVMRDATLMVRRDPRLAQFLDATHLGSHPAVVVRMVELARAQRAKGLLPK